MGPFRCPLTNSWNGSPATSKAGLETGSVGLTLQPIKLALLIGRISGVRSREFWEGSSRAVCINHRVGSRVVSAADWMWVPIQGSNWD